MWPGFLIAILAGPRLQPIAGWAEYNGLVAHKTLSFGLAIDLADAALQSCREAAARDLVGALMHGGGVPIEASGVIVGGFGVSDAPGGDQDDRCALDEIDVVLEQLEF
jgi:hypothetical protein